MLRSVGERVPVAYDDPRVAVAEAVVELLVREPPRERHHDRSAPLRSPVEERGLEPVVEDERDTLAPLEREPACDPPHARMQLAVRHAGKRLQLRVALAGCQQRPRQVHADATSSIASTIGAYPVQRQR